MHKVTFAMALLLFLSTVNAAQAQMAMRNGLPATSTDSFVNSAGSQAENIYGDECKVFGAEMVDYNPPPIFGFEKDNRINSGIFDQRAAGLTTGHGEYLPDAWGGDEWTGNEWDQATPQQTVVGPTNMSIALPSVNIPGITGSINTAGMTLPGITGSVSVPGVNATINVAVPSPSQLVSQAPNVVQSATRATQSISNAASGF